MTFADCPREQDVVDAVTTGQWPERCDGELHAHVAACDGCRDLIAILTPLGESWSETRTEASVPASGMVWWRAQLRARQEAARAAARPITVVQAIAGLAFVVIALLCLVTAFPWLVASLATSRQFLAFGVPNVSALAGGWLLAGGIAFLAIMSVAVYLVVAED